MTIDRFLEECKRIVGNGHVLTAQDEMAPYLTDWRGRFTGNAAAVLRPGIRRRSRQS